MGTSKKLKVYKNKKLNDASFNDYNLNDYQVFLHLITKLKKIDEAGNKLATNKINREVNLSAKEFATQFNLDINHVYKLLKLAGHKLARTAIRLEKPELFQIWNIPVATTVYNTQDGGLQVRFTEDIMPYISQVQKRWIAYDLKEVANFGSLYTTRLYELIQEFKDTGWLVKSIEQLREIFAVGTKFVKYNDLKRKTFGHAVEEINQQYDMNLIFVEVKDGKKVTSIHFTFTKTWTRKQYDPVTKKIINVTVKPKPKSPVKKQEDDTPEVNPNQLNLFELS